MALQHLRSSTADKRPLPGGLSDGQVAINTNVASPGLFFKDSTGVLVKVGPVHVGTTAPNASPAIGGQSGNSVGEQWLDTTGGTYVFKIWDGTAWRSETGTFVDVNGDVMTGAFGIIAGTAAAPGLYISGDTNTGIYSPGADQLALSTGGTGRLFIDASGNVGAGVATIRSQVHLSGTGQSTANLTDAGNRGGMLRLSGIGAAGGEGGALLFANNQSDAANSVGFAAIKGLLTNGADNTQGDLAFSTRATSAATALQERMRLDSSGRLGLGTSTVSSGHILQANGVIAAVNPFAAFSALQTAGGIGFRWTLSNDGTFRLQRTPDGFANAATPIIVDGSDRVGIGTTSPGAPLNVSAGSTALACRIQGTSSPYFSLLDSVANVECLIAADNNGTGVFGTISNHPYVFRTNNQERCRVDTSGRLLVGTSSQSGGSLLQINDNRIRIATAKTPASATDTGVAGEICWDANYVYVCTATNTWKRTAISTW